MTLLWVFIFLVLITLAVAISQTRNPFIKRLPDLRSMDSYEEIRAGRMAMHLLNKRVICRSNDYNKPLMIGTCTSISRITQAKSPVPIITSESDKQEYMMMGIVILYSEEMLELLSKKTNEEQWDFLSQNRFDLSQ